MPGFCIGDGKADPQQVLLAEEGERMEGESMTEKELITITIDTYMNLQRIKKENGDCQNRELDYQLKGVIAKLSSMGVNVEDITL